MTRYRWMMSLLILSALILSACQPVMPVETNIPMDKVSADSDSEAANPSWDKVFIINSFARRGFDQYEEFVCQIDVDCSNRNIPVRLGGFFAGERISDPTTVPQLTIVFQLDSDYSELLLRLIRAGSETTSISVDGREPVFVTSEMLGSREGSVFGSYELALGPLQSGAHSITFSVLDDGKGNGKYLWRALSLTAR